MSSSIFITGGCGFLGRALLKRWHSKYAITVYNRDEHKQHLLKQRYPQVRFVLGDIRDYGKMLSASKGCHHAVFAASMKHIDACSSNAAEAIDVIVNGALVSRKVAIENYMEAACFISTDKSRNPSTLYGGAKFLAGESFILDEDINNTFTALSTLIYGNVFDSTGSILPVIRHAIREGRELCLFDERMTRFAITIDQAIDLIEIALELSPNHKDQIASKQVLHSYQRVNLIPNLRSFLVKDLFDLFQEYFGLQYRVTQPRIGEKIHEELLSDNDALRTFYDESFNIFVNNPRVIADNPCFQSAYSSKDNPYTKEELCTLLQENNLFYC